MSHFSILPTEPDPEDLRDQHVDQFRRLIEEDGTASAPDVERLVDTLAANGGGDLSSDLALDILLNAIVDQARLATGASGAAIALVKDGEMVCRATAGPRTSAASAARRRCGPSSTTSWPPRGT